MADKKVINTLVIEDDPFSVAVLEHYGARLKDFKLNINHTVTLEESLSFLDKQPQVELIFLDYRIHSKLTGLEILQHIRAKGVKVPVIVVTGSGNEEVAVSMIKAGASDYLVKGHLSEEVLELSIRRALEQQKIFKHVLEQDTVLKDMAIKTSLNGVCTLDLDGRINYTNPSFNTMWGYDREDDVRGRFIKEFFAEPKEWERVYDALETKRSWLGEIIGRKKDGLQFYLQTLFSMIEFRDKEPHQIMASFIDITKVKDSEKKREALYRGIMEVFALRAEEVGNVETAGHIHRIAAYTKFIAERLRELELFMEYIDDKYISDISYASMLHDVGKWRTPNEILLKPSELTEAEWEIIKQHPKLGVQMLMPLLKEKGSNQYLKLVESIVMHHHEKWSGLGYPEGLRGEEIPLSARIVALADVYDALTSDRSYRKALTHEEAVVVMKNEQESFDPRIWDIFINNQGEFKHIKDQI
ncbi:MAG: HD domain-containing phosphohydrolase, partial [Candidatus Omnitrophota bacterium]